MSKIYISVGDYVVESFGLGIAPRGTMQDGQITPYSCFIKHAKVLQISHKLTKKQIRECEWRDFFIHRSFSIDGGYDNVVDISGNEIKLKENTIGYYDYESAFYQDIDKITNYTGKFIRRNEAGCIVEQGFYISGKRHDEWKTFYDNGNVKTLGTYFVDDKVGVWVEFYEDKKLKQVTNVISKNLTEIKSF